MKYLSQFFFSDEAEHTCYLSTGRCKIQNSFVVLVINFFFDASLSALDLRIYGPGPILFSPAGDVFCA